jgi:hypothetical protein
MMRSDDEYGEWIKRFTADCAALQPQLPSSDRLSDQLARVARAFGRLCAAAAALAEDFVEGLKPKEPSE